MSFRDAKSTALQLASAAADAKAYLLSKTNPTHIGRNDPWLLDWLVNAETLISQVTAETYYELGEEWSSAGNIVMIFRAQARRLAERATPGSDVCDQLNALANARPFLFPFQGSFETLRTLDFASPRLCDYKVQWDHLLGTGGDRTPLRVLIIRPHEGLSTCLFARFLSKAVPTSIDLVDSPLPIMYERSLLEQNLSNLIHACSDENLSVQIRHMADIPEDPIYDSVLLQGHHSFDESLSALTVLDRMMWAWKRLRLGGLLSVDDQRAQEGLLYRALWPASFMHATDAFIRVAGTRFRTIGRNNLLSLERRRA